MSSRGSVHSGVLTPPCPSFDSGRSTAGCKRKRDESGHLVAKPYPGVPGSSPVSLHIICPLSRFSLPFAWLDTTTSSTLFPSGNICQFKSEILDAPYQGAFSVLVVRHPVTGDLYVLERLDGDIHTSLKLADWVTEGQIINIRDGKPLGSIVQNVLAVQAMQARLKGKNSKATEGFNTPLLQSPLPKQPKIKRGAIALMEIMSKAIHPASDALHVGESTRSDVSTGNETPAETSSQYMNSQDQPLAEMADVVLPLNTEQNPQKAAERPDDMQSIFDKLHSQYLEILYTSKTSVGYFAKGPLARARAYFSTSTEGSRTSDLLAQFYRDSIISLKRLDLKYKESVLNCIRSQEADGRTKSRKRKKSKHKIGRDGLYADEEDYIRQWWRNITLGHGGPDLSRDSELERIKTIAAELRNRETQLQILIVLETMVLEQPSTSVVKQEPVEADLKGIPVSRKQDLRTQLDLLLDRLCIWHTIALDDIVEDKAPGEKPNDQLRDFCVEVVIPFYASKLPEQCKALSKKLGGPSDISSKRHRGPLTKSASMSKVVPGAEMTRPRPPKSLQRALTADVSRSRSPSVPLLKMDPSERPASRSGMHAKLLENRQVDLAAVAKQQQSKLKKMKTLAEHQKQLDAAISMLRKPNRGVVARDIVEEVERLKQSSKDVKRSERGVQVIATPKKRKISETQTEPYLHGTQTINAMATIPSSSVRPTAIGTSTAPRVSIEETPSRSAARLSNPLGLPQKPPAEYPDCMTFTTPSKSLKTFPPPPTIVEATPTAVRTGLIGRIPAVSQTPDAPLAPIVNTPLTAKLRMTKSQRPVEFTPLKKSDSRVMEAFTNAPEVTKTAMTEDDIYARLGWMDDSFD